MSHFSLFSLCLLAFSIFSVDARQVSCEGTQEKIDSNVERLYNWFFRDFVESQERQGRDTLKFEAIAFLSTSATQGVDLGEFLYSQRLLEDLTSNVNISVSEVARLWNITWSNQAENLVSQAPRKITRANACLVSSLYHRAAMYLQLSIRLANQVAPATLQIYQRSVNLFAIAAAIEGCGVPSCKMVKIPYRDEDGPHSLHGYLCFANQGATPSELDIPQTTILAFSGYDCTAELTYHEMAVAAIRNGFNVLIFDGPGQGATARFSNLKFRSDWETVVSQVADFVLSFFRFKTTRFVVWGRSLGGYLAPRAFAREPRIDVLVADGGVFDFFQAFVCKLPENLRNLYYSNPQKFSSLMAQYSQYSFSLQFLLNNGEVGFGTRDMATLLNYFQNYTMQDSMSLLVNRPMLINNPLLDTLTGNQSSIFLANAPYPRSNFTRMIQLDPSQGAGLHCSVGSTSSSITQILYELKIILHQM